MIDYSFNYLCYSYEELINYGFIKCNYSFIKNCYGNLKYLVKIYYPNRIEKISINKFLRKKFNKNEYIVYPDSKNKELNIVMFKKMINNI